MMRRLSKAVKYATLFEQLCAERTDDRTALEAEVRLYTLAQPMRVA